MILAVVLASLAWLVAVEGSNPTLQQRYPQPIPVTLSGLSEGLVVVESFDAQVMVTLRAPRSVWDTLEVDDFVAEADVSALEAGTHEVPVDLLLDESPARIIEVTPSSVSVTLDTYLERSVPVRIDVEGDPALGYRTRKVVSEPDEVTVSGPTTYVTQVVEADASISVQGAQADVEDDLRLQPRDEAGESVSSVDLTPEEVHVRVPIEPSGYYRPLAVKVSLEGEVAPGYRVIDITVDPPTVTVFGAPNVLSALQGFIETQPIDVEGAQSNVTVQPALNVPENVSVVPGQQVEVKVFVEPIESSVTMEVVPEVQGLGPDLEATVSPETVEIILSGPLPILNDLEPDDIRVVVDLFDLSSGTHQLEPEVFVPEGVTAKSVIPSTLQVEIDSS